MKLPTEYNDDFLGYETGFGMPYPDGVAVPAHQIHVHSLVYPPIGFFPFYGIGNGDYHGFYWPIGREQGPPIVAFTSHDVGSLIPENSDIQSLYRCCLARGDDESRTVNDYRDLAEAANGTPPGTHDIRGIEPGAFLELLQFDPTSPYYLCAAADLDASNNQLDAAEVRYRAAIEQLPEYIAAHFGLASLLRRQRRPEEASIHLRKSLIGPLVFYGGSFWSDTSLPGSFRNDWLRKSLMWLQRSSTFHETLADDPFVASIRQLTFQTGLAHNPDIDILQSIVDHYAAKGQFSEATRIWQLIGERASYETTSFRERYHLTPATFGTRLAELFTLAGNELRAALTQNMVKALEKPDGLYL